MKQIYLIVFSWLAYNAIAQDQTAISLTNPDKPAKLCIGLVSGSITVESHLGKDIILIPSNEEKGGKQKENKKATGLKKIDSRGAFSFTAEENNNEVKITSHKHNFEGLLLVKVPKNTSLQLSTINGGDIVVSNVNGNHEISNVNGNIIGNGMGGAVSATTVNGDISFDFTSLNNGSPIAFSNLNGDIELSIPSTANFNVEANSDNGEIYTDFEVNASNSSKIVTNKTKGEHKILKTGGVTFKINDGGPGLMCTSMNGDIMIKKK
jgi:hypothetical protein